MTRESSNFCAAKLGCSSAERRLCCYAPKRPSLFRPTFAGLWVCLCCLCRRRCRPKPVVDRREAVSDLWVGSLSLSPSLYLFRARGWGGWWTESPNSHFSLHLSDSLVVVVVVVVVVVEQCLCTGGSLLPTHKQRRTHYFVLVHLSLPLTPPDYLTRPLFIRWNFSYTTLLDKKW